MRWSWSILYNEPRFKCFNWTKKYTVFRRNEPWVKEWNDTSCWQREGGVERKIGFRRSCKMAAAGQWRAPRYRVKFRTLSVKWPETFDRTNERSEECKQNTFWFFSKRGKETKRNGAKCRRSSSYKPCWARRDLRTNRRLKPTRSWCQWLPVQVTFKRGMGALTFGGTTRLNVPGSVFERVKTKSIL